MSSRYVTDPLQSAQIHTNETKISLNPTVGFQGAKQRLWIIKITYLSVESNKLQRVLPRA